MSIPIDFAEKWIAEAPHKTGCAAIAAGAENCCSCGKREAENQASYMSACDGDCSAACQARDEISGLEEDAATVENAIVNMIDAESYKTMTREDVASKLREILDL